MPLCERLTFASIYQSTLDEFFMVRVGSLMDQELLDQELRENKTNMTPGEQIHAILKEVKKLNDRRDSIYTELMEKLEAYGVRLVDFRKIGKEESDYLEKYFEAEMWSVSSVNIWM